MYQKVYKCRMCGEQIFVSFSDNKLHANIELSHILTKQFEKMFLVHGCRGGDIGVAYLQGIKSVKDEINGEEKITLHKR